MVRRHVWPVFSSLSAASFWPLGPFDVVVVRCIHIHPSCIGRYCRDKEERGSNKGLHCCYKLVVTKVMVTYRRPHQTQHDRTVLVSPDGWLAYARTGARWGLSLFPAHPQRARHPQNLPTLARRQVPFFSSPDGSILLSVRMIDATLRSPPPPSCLGFI